MKQALRACLDIWRRLPGEIDFDDVLILCIVRETQPEAFATIQSNLYYLRDGRTAREDERGSAQKAWEDSLKILSMDDRSRAAAKCLVEFMFGERHAGQKPQGVSQHYHADYWERFLSIPKLEDRERDQPVLQTMLAPDDAALLDSVQSASLASSAVEDFERLLPTGRLVGLFLPLVERRSRESPELWKDQDPPGLIPLWRMWNRRWERGELPSDTVLDQVKRALSIAVPHNLGLATDIEEYFVVSSPSVPQLLGGHERAEAKKYFRALLVATYRSRGDALSRSLRGAKAPTLLWLCWGLDRVRSRATGGVPFEEWADFVPTIIEAVRHDPRTMLAQVAYLVVSQSVVIARKSGLQYEFNAEAASRLFGDVETVAALFREEDVANWGGSPEVEAVLAHFAQATVRADPDNR